MQPSPGAEQPRTVDVEDRGLRFPALCPHCLQTASTAVPIQNAFVRGESASAVVTFRAFFCASCAALHRREMRKPGLEIWFKRLLAGGTASFTGVINLGIALFLTPRLLPGVFESGWNSLIALGVLAFFYGVSAVGLWSAIKSTAHLAVPPPTSVSSAISFGDDQSKAFEPDWRRFEFRHSLYADHFRQINAARVWNKKGEKARRAATRKKIAWIFGILSVLILLTAGNLQYIFHLWDTILEWLRL